ncbi:MAG: hypothetical protein J0G30_12495 [Actinomycetales bacterium]|nr:hypothetical protein [Actinomycetales bacterium]
MGLIADARHRTGTGVRELARRAAVAPPSIYDWEGSEANGTIQIGTLRRALEAMEERLIVTSRPAHRDVALPLRREQRIGLELHRQIARALIDDPDRALAHAAGRIQRLRDGVRGSANDWIDEWVDLIERRDLGGLIDVMLGARPRDADLRSVSPFTGLLSESERRRALERAVAP